MGRESNCAEEKLISDGLYALFVTMTLLLFVLRQLVLGYDLIDIDFTTATTSGGTPYRSTCTIKISYKIDYRG